MDRMWKRMAGGTCAVLLLSLWLQPARAAVIDLRVLVIATDTADQDPGRKLMEDVLEQLGVPYDVLDSSRTPLTPQRLYAGSHGFYSGIILTNSETYLPGGGTGLDQDEFALLHDYERHFGVRETVMSGFPVTNPALGLDYGMGDVSWTVAPRGRWLPPAGGTERFEYVNTESVLPTRAFAFTAVPRNGLMDPQVTPLLVDHDDPARTLVSHITYPDGREVLLSTMDNAWFFVHSHVLAYEMLSFATQGLFLGARHVYLSLHNDDLFLPSLEWNPETNSNWPGEARTFRMRAHDVDNLVASQEAFRAAHPLFEDIAVELAFNGAGVGIGQTPDASRTLTDAIAQHRGALRFINHTFDAQQMDRLCPDPDEPPGLCRATDYDTVLAEVEGNRAVWRDMDLPAYSENTVALLTDSHSGLYDRNGTLDDPSDDIHFPHGANQRFLRAARDLGVRVIAADASRPNQDRIQRVPGFDLVLLPRYPTAVFYNTNTPRQLVSEYNYIHHGRYLERGDDPCDIPGAICTPRTYEEILDAEAEITARHMLSYIPFPHYFHQNNLCDYDSQGSTLQFDWLTAVAGFYEQLMDLPVRSPRFHEQDAIARAWLSHREIGVQGRLDTDTGEVTIWSRRPGTAMVTGVFGGELYGGQSIHTLPVSPRPQVLPADPALDR